MEFGAADYLDLAHTSHADLFAGTGPVWQVLPQIGPYLRSVLKPGFHGEQRGQAFISGEVYVGKGAVISHGVTIMGPVWIGEGTYIGPGCYIRENTILGSRVIIGNSCELKNCVFFDRAEAPHWNYVGDSILGHKAHLGAGSMLSNYRLDHGPVTVIPPEEPHRRIETGLTKFGAIVGDESDIGSNAVLSPGSFIGRQCMIYPQVHWSGVLAARRIVKLRQQLLVIERQ
ncbi:MAG: UDP-N-acetylglucosamine diphosphorylase [Verrucomicrobiales bacterium]|nr:UDP-N-acetylglucosamine diphosphorylase [Verrucomicrobiales bacterium]